MGKLSFQTDDPELLDFVYSLGRERSKIICALLRDCMEEGDGYVPPRIMAVTGFSYKNKKSIKRAGKDITSKPKQVSKRPKHLHKEETVSVQQDVTTDNEEKKPDVTMQVPAQEASEPMPEPVPASAPVVSEQAASDNEESYVSSAPKINNTGFIMAGLSAFGGM